MNRMNARALLLLLVCCILAWPGGSALGEQTPDLAVSVSLDETDVTQTVAVKVETFIDGDTVYFRAPEGPWGSGVLKARFIGLDTPESTGRIEEFGRAAAAFTREKLNGADSIIVESDTEQWERDSIGERFLVWVWYRVPGETAYRNLNIELLQNGLAAPKSSAQNRYGDVCMAAIGQAREAGLHIWSGQPDPDYYYGDAIELTLKELRCRTELYDGKRVAFNGVVVMSHYHSVYVESLDAESGLAFGIPVYYGFGLNGWGLDILSVGNEVRVVGTVSYYESGGVWQVSDVDYRMMHPDDPDNLQLIRSGCEPLWTEAEPSELAGGEITLTLGDEAFSMPYARAVMDTTISLSDLKVTDVRTYSDGQGAAILTCEADGVNLKVAVWQPPADVESLIGKTVGIRGLVSVKNEQPLINVYTSDGVTLQE